MLKKIYLSHCRERFTDSAGIQSIHPLFNLAKILQRYLKSSRNKTNLTVSGGAVNESTNDGMRIFVSHA